MAQSTANMGLRQWNLATDFFESGNLSSNWTKVDLHDHTTGKGVQIPRAGIQNQAIDSTKLANLAVGTPQLADDAVTIAKLADNAVGTSQLVDGSIQTAKIAASQITSALIADGTITVNDLATIVLNHFIKSAGDVNRTFNVGVTGSFSGFTAVGDESQLVVPHGLASTPTVAIACQGTAPHAGSGVRVDCAIIAKDATNITISGTCVRQPIAPVVTANAFWIAVT